MESRPIMNQKDTPLFNQLKKHAEQSPQSFHVPGHKNGRVFYEKAKTMFQDILHIDQTEIEGLDDLHEADGVIAEAEQLAAELYGVRKTNFLVGGSTAGNLAMMMTAAERGETVLVQRSSHQSVFHGIELAGVKPVFLEPEGDEETGTVLGVSLRTLKEGIAAFPEAKAVFLTSPTYEGYGQPLSEHVQAAHKAGLMVCVDEAHGAHLIYEKGASWPQSAIKAGADMVVHSAHKSLPAMTMSSFIHVNSSRVNEERLRYCLRMLQSSSPSYPLMASLDTARAYLASFTDSDWRHITARVAQFKEEVGRGSCWGQTPQKLGNYVQDPLKLAFVTRFAGVPFKWKRRMEESNVFPELVSPYHLLLTLPLTSELPSGERWPGFFQEVLHLNKDDIERYHTRRKTAFFHEKNISGLAYTIDEMRNRETSLVPWTASKGFISAETITPYPPGIPLVLKGERIERTHVARLAELVDAGASFQTGKKWIEEGIKIFLQ